MLRYVFFDHGYSATPSRDQKAEDDTDKMLAFLHEYRERLTSRPLGEYIELAKPSSQTLIKAT